jgi:hypothetical protein
MYCNNRSGRLAVIMAMPIMALMVVGIIGVGVAIQRQILVPPQLDLRIGSVRILANSSGPQLVPACLSLSPTLYVPTSAATCSQQSYVVWIVIQTGASDDMPWMLQLLNVQLKGN